jgi:HK97 family phage prohead protease
MRLTPANVRDQLRLRSTLDDIEIVPVTERQPGDTARLRQLPVRFRLLEGVDVQPGAFECIASTYNIEIDAGWGWREMMLPGCFAESLAENPNIPVFWQHDWYAGPIGVAVATEEPEQLRCVGQLFLEDARVPSIYRAMQAQAVREWSIGFYANEIVTSDEDRYLEKIQKGDLAEVSSVVRGANPVTETVDLRRKTPGERKRTDPAAPPAADLEVLRNRHARALLRRP